MPRQLYLSAWVASKQIKALKEPVTFQNHKDTNNLNNSCHFKRSLLRPLSFEELLWYMDLQKHCNKIYYNVDSLDKWDGSIDNQEKILEDDYSKGRR